MTPAGMPGVIRRFFDRAISPRALSKARMRGGRDSERQAWTLSFDGLSAFLRRSEQERGQHIQSFAVCDQRWDVESTDAVLRTAVN